jgi:WD40 repeat protein
MRGAANVSPDGSLVIAAPDDHSPLGLYDAATGKDLRSGMTPGPLSSIAVTPDGLLIAALGPLARSWSLATGAEQTPLEVGTSTVFLSNLAASKDSVVGLLKNDRDVRDTTLVAWSPTERQVRRLPSGRATLRSTNLVSATRALAGTIDGHVIDADPRSEAAGTTRAIASFRQINAVTTLGDDLLVGNENGRVDLVSLAGESRRTFEPQTNPLSACVRLIPLPDGSFLSARVPDVKRWRTADPAPVWTASRLGKVRGMAWAGKLVAVASAAPPRLSILSLETGEVLSSLELEPAPTCALEFSPDGTRLFAATPRGAVLEFTVKQP